MLKYARTFAISFVLTGSVALGALHAAQPGLLVTNRLSGKNLKPLQSITVRVMPEEVFHGEEGSVYVSYRSESSCVAWVDQAAVAGRKAAGKDVLRAAFEECGKTFE